MDVWLDVPAIPRGYDAEIVVPYSTAFWDDAGLDAGRLVAQFRISPDGDVLFEADSDAATVLRDRPCLTLKVPATATVLFVGQSVLFDIAVADASPPWLIPGRFTWPVYQPITRSST